MQEDNNKVKNFSFIKKNNKTKIFVFFICLVISIILWFVFNISKNTTSEIKIKFKISNAPKSLVIEKNYPVSIYVSGNGIDLIKSHIKTPKAQLELDYNKLAIKIAKNQPQSKYILSSDLKPYFNNILTGELKIDSLSPDTIKFQNINLIKSVLLPIEIDAKYSIDKKSMMINNEIKILGDKDSVLVEGDEELLKHIKKVKTQFVDLGEIDENLVYNLKLETNRELKYSFTDINISFPIEKYSEITDSIEIELRNFPEGKIVQIFPSTIKLKYKVPISLYKQINANNFIVTVDYNKRRNSERIFIDVFSKNKNVSISEYYPLSVKYVVETQK